MVQVSSSREYQGNAFGAISSFGAIFCMVIAVLGIKFKWFKRRLDLQQVPVGDGRQNRIRGQSSDDILSHGVFRKRFEDEILSEAERSKTLPPIRIRSSIKDITIPLPQVAVSSKVRPISQPSRPTVPPPSDIHRTVSTGAIPRISNNRQEEQRNGIQIKETINSKPTSFRKNGTSATKLPPKYDYSKNSVDEIDDNSQRRQTGLFLLPAEKANLDSSFTKNYSEGFGIPDKSFTNQAPDILTSIQETSPDNTQVPVKAGPNFKQSELEEYSKDNENDIFAVIRLPKPEPRRSIAATQSRKTLDMAGSSKDDTEI